MICGSCDCAVYGLMFFWGGYYRGEDWAAARTPLKCTEGWGVWMGGGGWIASIAGVMVYGVADIAGLHG